jgi:hypothetical protein
MGQKGELLLPMIAAIFLFGIFSAFHIQWCRHVYWKMRMDMTADATALSAAREEAARLNTIGTLQYLENGLLQKGKLFGEDVGVVQASGVKEFKGFVEGMKADLRLYALGVFNLAHTVAKMNGATRPPIPVPVPQHHLKPQAVPVVFLHGVIPIGGHRYPTAYYARDWWPLKKSPQPIHRATWWVWHGGIGEKGKARLWLDVDPNRPMSNGGFPSEHASFWQSLGIQCNYPQFNARLMAKN